MWLGLLFFFFHTLPKFIHTESKHKNKYYFNILFIYFNILAV